MGSAANTVDGLEPALIALFACLSLVLVIQGTTLYLVYRRLSPEDYLKYWSINSFTGLLQVATFTLAYTCKLSLPPVIFGLLLATGTITGHLQPAFLLLAAISLRRKPSRATIYGVIAAACLLAVAVLAVSQSLRLEDVPRFRIMAASRMTFSSIATAWFALAFYHRKNNAFASSLHNTIPILCGIQALHQFLAALNHITAGAIYFSAASEVGAMIAIFLNFSLLLALLLGLTEQAQRANAAKSVFLSTMSHEMRTPLAGLIGLSSILSASKLDGEQKELSNAIELCANSVLSLVDDILDLTKIDAGRKTVKLQPCVPRAMLDELRAMFQATAAAKGIAWNAVCRQSVPGIILTDPALLKQILLNLIGNALKFTERGEINIELDYLKGMLQVTVTDTGIGIPPADLPHLGEPFFQAANTTNIIRGTGLGLSLCREVVKLMGGAGLRIDSHLGQGSTFRFSIPAPIAHAAPQTKSVPVPTPAPTAMRILLAEDNKVNQMVMMKMLQRLGHSVLLAANGEEALECMRHTPADLILMDFRMPVMDGIQATRLIRQSEIGQRRVPIIAVTANAFREDRDQCLAVGMDDFLTKPITMEALAASIAKWQPRETVATLD